MTDLQRAELSLFSELLHICTELKLKYYLVCGSALGAAKYKGFIPWDDDLDVGLPRPDYERFIRLAPQLLPEHVFLQNYHSDPAFPQIFSKLRDSRTTFVEKTASELPINHGVYIDIFPLDGYPEAAAEIRRFELLKKMWHLQAQCAFKSKCSMKAQIFFSAERMLGYARRTDRTMAKMDALFKSYSPESSEIWCNHGNWQGKLEYHPKSVYGEGYMTSFEGLEVCIPAQYDTYLTQKYGDWRADLPEEERVGHHYTAVIDLNRPYTDYIEILPKGKARLIEPPSKDNK